MSIYLDHNATTPLDERVLAAMYPYLTNRYGNPSSVHSFGRQVRGAIDLAREQVAALVNAHPSQVVFTSGGTEANNMVFAGVREACSPGGVLVSAIEHPSVLRATRHLSSQQWQVEQVGVDVSGCISREKLAEMIDGQSRLVSIMSANNETGVIQDIPTLADECRSRGVLFHSDAIQALGKIKVDFIASGVHLMTLSSHKIYGPQGCGALIMDKSVGLSPLMYGGGQERKRRAGTENVAAIVGFGHAAELAALELEQDQRELLALREQLEAALLSVEGITLLAAEAERLPNTVMFAVDGVAGETMLMALDTAGYAVSSGSACESGSEDPSHVLMAMGVSRDVALSSIRVSLGKSNTEQEIEGFITALKQQIQMMRMMACR